MFNKVKKSVIIKWSIKLSIIIALYCYHIFRPAIIFHTPNEYEYLGKIVCTYNERLKKIYVNKYRAIYRIPYTRNWSEDHEVAIFMGDYGNVLYKKDIDFWRLDIYLDDQRECISQSKRKFLGIYPW